MKHNIQKTINRLVLIILFLSASGCSKMVHETIEMPPRDLKVVIKSITVQPFSGSPKGERFAEYLRNQIVNAGAVQVLKSGGEATLTGSLTIGQINTQEYSSTSPITINGQVQVIYYIKKSFSSGVTYAVEKDGKIIGGNSYSSNYENTWTGSSSGEARASAQSDDTIVGGEIGALAKNIVDGISTHKENWSFKMQDGGNDQVKLGVEYYRKGLYSQAEEYWKKVVASSQQSKEKAAAYYDLGVYAMRERRFEEAFKDFREADSLEPANEVYMEALAMAEKAQKGTNDISNMKPPVEENGSKKAKSGHHKKSHR